MSEASFPGPGPDGEQPPPGIPARDETAGMPAGVPAEDDWDGDAEMAAYIADLEAGRARIPEEWEIEGPAATISLGDAADVDLTELAAMLGPDGLGGEVFAQDRSAGAMRPGPVLSALTEQAAGDLGRLTDNQVIGAMSAARRLAARAAYLELTAVAEFTRRREAQLADATARRVPRGCRDGEFPDAELAYELVTSSNAARDQMDLATDLETRLPRTWAALGAGRIDEYRARLIWRPTRCLSDADAADADELLAGLAPGLRYDQLARKATAVAMKLDPEAFKRGKDKERRDRQRVVAGREESGNAYLSARELAIEDALASKAHIDALAVMLRRGGLPGTLQHLRVLAFNDLTQGRSPLDRLTSPPPTGQGGLGPSGGASQAHSVPCGDTGAGEGGHDSTDAGDSGDASWDGYPDMPEWQHERRGTTEDDDHQDDAPATPAGPPAPFPALINLTVPAGNIFGWSSAPGEAGSWGLTDPDDTRRLVQAASPIPAPAGASPSSGPTAPRSRTAAPAVSTPGYRRRKAAEPGTGRTRGRPLRSPTSCATSTSRSPRSPRAAAITAMPRTGTPPAASSNTWSAPAPRPARRPAAARRPTTTISTTPSPTPPGSPASATWPRPAAAIIGSSRHPAGRSPSPSPASCAGPHPPDAATPPDPPSTTPREPHGRLPP